VGFSLPVAARWATGYDNPVTIPPGPELPPYESPPPPVRGRSRWGVIVAWLMIVASALALMVRPRWLEHGSGSPDPLPPLPVVERMRSPQLQLIGRYAIGAKALAGGQAPPATLLIGQIDQVVINPIDEVRAIPVVAELSGPKAALERLDRFEKEHRVVQLKPDVDALRTIYARGVDQITPEQARSLVKRHQWFGRLAVSYGLPETDPRRQGALQPARRTVLIMGATVLLGLGAVAIGVALAILTIILWLQRRIVPAYVPPPPRLAGPFVEAFAIYLVGMVVLSQTLGRLFPNAGLSLTFVLFALLPVAWLYLRLRGVGWSEMMRGLGWYRGGGGFWREVGVGVYGYFAGLPVLALGMLTTWFLMKMTGNTATHPIVNQPMDHAGQVLELFLLACVGAPIVEETMFRGALFGHLRARFGWWISALIVSLIFAAIHPQGWVAIPLLGAIALVLAGLREWRGSLVASMTAHALNNAVAVLLLILLMG
jgi:membrane protease YdiL (CAAX protease family)